MEEGRHSQKAIRLVQEIIARLQAIPDGCAERFPFELIEELENAYLWPKRPSAVSPSTVEMNSEGVVCMENNSLNEIEYDIEILDKDGTTIKYDGEPSLPKFNSA